MSRSLLPSRADPAGHLPYLVHNKYVFAQQVLSWQTRQIMSDLSLLSLIVWCDTQTYTVISFSGSWNIAPQIYCLHRHHH
jgi:hypothetical protein